MRILFCTSTFEHVNHGPAKFANLLLSINNLYTEHEVRILTEDVANENLAQYGGKVYKVTFQFNKIQQLVGLLYRMVPYYKEAISIKSHYDYDVVVFNNAMMGIYSAVKLPVPVVGMINDDINVTKHLRNFEFNKRWFRGIIFKFFERLACKYEAHIIVNSNFLLQCIQKHYKISLHRISKLYKSVDGRQITFSERAIFQNPVNVLFVKSNYYNGGVFDLIDALHLLEEYHFNLSIVGPDCIGIKEIRSYCLNKKNNNVSLTFLGRISQQEVFHHMKRTDIFSVPSRQEALGVANIEALMHGIPVVSTTAGGIPEVLGGGRYGWLAKPGDYHDLARKFRECIQDTSERQNKCRQGNNYMRLHFNKDRMLERFIFILESALLRR